VRLQELAERLGCRLDGDGTIDVTKVAGLEDAEPGDLTFLASSKYASRLAATRASAVLADDSVSGAPCAVLRTPHVYLAFAEAIAILTPPARPAPGISALASIHPTARLGLGVSVGPFVVIGPAAVVGARTVLHPHVCIGPGAVVGDDCEIHAHASVREYVTVGARGVIKDGAVVGGEGFGFARRPDGSHQKIPQVGRVVLEDDVEIGANSTVDRPAVGETRVSAGTKIDNQVQVGHGVKIGRRVLLASQVGIAGSTIVEDDVVLAGQVGVADHLRIGRGAVANAQAGISRDIEAGLHVAGLPAEPVAQWRESAVLIRRLPDLRRAVKALDARLAALEARLRASSPE
jgi:UDP-3-O-[3-hydroxymyristoyl] glucosamine N-acyltransferase